MPPIWELTVVCVVGMALVLVSQWIARAPAGSVPQPMRDAAEIMDLASETLKAYRLDHDLPLDTSTDINETGLIGEFFSSITTTVGNLEAKRTTTNPNMAGVMVDLLNEVGVEAGDMVAVGASGSFPALILATLSAAHVLEARVALIVSLGSSQFGANIPQFTWLDMEQVLVDSGVLSSHVVAASLGGDLDIARDLGADARALLDERIAESGVQRIYESDLQANVLERMSVYRESSGGEGIAAFVNIGGASANMGIDSSILTAAPGIVQFDSLPDAQKQGVMHAMAAEGVPIIHLLNIKDLAGIYGLPWDPSPLPMPGMNIRSLAGGRKPPIGASLAYLAGVTLWFATILRRRVRRSRRRRIEGGASGLHESTG